jgi:ATP-dependent helicase HrpB
MIELPVSQVIPDIQQQLLQHNRLVLQAPPGAGKTTAVPIALLDQPWLGNKKIILLEPRRLAARNAAARMAFLLNEKVGDTVGYMIRAERVMSNKTRILVVTEGILTRLLQSDPELADVALVIFDEFHERNLHADVSLAFCLQSQELLRPDLKILVMSATLNTAAVSQLLNHAPVITSEGRSYPVDNIFLPPGSDLPEKNRIADAVNALLMRIVTQETGNVLVFLPGVKEIRQIESRLQGWLSENKISNLIIAPLYGDLGKAQQDQAILPCAHGKRKIVLATNIAETSLTIEGVSVVVDSGLQRESRFYPGSGMNRLETVYISQDSAEQRSGRAGRLSAGKCFRLWTESQHKKLPRHSTPEILISDLAPLMLELANWGAHHINELHWLDLPNEGSAAQARELLCELGALDHDFRITTHGQKMLSLGTHPRFAHMILRGAELGCSEAACLLAALLSEKDIYRGNARHADMDKRMTLLQAVKAGDNTRNTYIDNAQCQLVLRSAEQIAQKLRASEYKIFKPHDCHPLHGVLLGFAYPDRIGQLRNEKDRRYLLANGKGAILDEQDELQGTDYLVAAELDGAQREARIYKAAALSLKYIEEYFPELIESGTTVCWNEHTQRVDASRKTRLGAIVLNETIIEAANQDQIHHALLEGIRLAGIECLPWNKESTALRQRMQFLYILKQNAPELDHKLAQLDLPDLSNQALLQNLEHWLLPHLSGQNSLKKLQSLDLVNILLSTLSWPQQKYLDELAPTHITVPSGSRIAIDYSDPHTPVLAVRLQELFGQQDTPVIANGKVKVLVHLLSPGYQPMQVTQDLASFWRTTYFEVKKELCGRYKKHYWPDDPLTAQATNKTKRFMDKQD